MRSFLLTHNGLVVSGYSDNPEPENAQFAHIGHARDIARDID